MRSPRLALAAFAVVSACATAEEPSAVTPDDVVVDAPEETADDASEASVDAAPVDVTDVRDVVDASDVTDATLDANDAALDGMSDVHDELSDAALDAPRPDAGVMGDSLPTNAVMFFSTASCPEGWVSYDDAAGRVIVPTTGGAAGGAVRGLPLRSGEERTHTHRLSSGFTFGGVSYVGVVGGGNQGVGAAGAVTFSTATDPATAGIPYVQMLVCRKTAAAVSRTLALPSGMMMFYAGERCPTGFTQAPGTQGRVEIGLPAGGMNGATFGGAPLGTVDGPTHTHGANVAVSAGSHGIALASGCCGSGYARAGMYTATATSAASDPELPTITLLQCMRD